MSFTTASDSLATGLESDLNLPPNLDPKTHRIIATHFYGVDLREVREVFWDLARQGHPPPAEPGVILLDGGAS